MLLLQEFDLEINYKKGIENLAIDHLFRIENPHMGTMSNQVLNDTFLEEHLYRVGQSSDSKTP